MSLLRLDNLAININLNGKDTTVVNDVSFEVNKGQIVALVGESGCGKSLTCLSLARLHQEPLISYPEGEIILSDKNNSFVDILKLSRPELEKIRGGVISYIFQEPTVSLNPVFRIGDQIAEAVILHRPEVKDIRAETIKLLQDVGIPAPEQRINSYPHEMSGGMQQRVMIAMALASSPQLLIADEPTTALDVTIQAQILELIEQIGREKQMGVLLVTHNLGIVSQVADFVVVMYAGSTVESGPCEELISNPLHPYTKALLRAVPRLDGSDRELTTIPGTVPSAGNYPPGCRFYGRCSLAASKSSEEQKLCAEQFPGASRTANHFCRCHYV